MPSSTLARKLQGTGEFVLTDATAKGHAPEAAEKKAGEAETTYQLRGVSGITESGVDTDELRKHVGSLVEVTVRPPEASVPETPPGVSQPGDVVRPEAVAEPAPQIFSVTAVRAQRSECG